MWKIGSICVLLFFCIEITPAFSQSIAYKLLLHYIYDPQFETIKPESVKENDYLFLDTREKEEFEISHIKGAIWVGHEDFDINRLSGIPKDHPLIVYCTVGSRSEEVGKWLMDRGFSQVKNLYGGIIHWKNEGNPVHNHQGESNRVHTYSRTWGIWLKKGEKIY